MVRYLPTPENRGKVEYLCKAGAVLLAELPASFSSVERGKALLVVIENGAFETAAVVTDSAEFEMVAEDWRPARYLLIDTTAADKLSPPKEW